MIIYREKNLIKRLIAVFLIVPALIITSSGCTGQQSENNSGYKNTEPNEDESKLNEYKIYAKNYYISVGELSFEKTDTVPADKLIPYFRLFEIRDEKGNIKKQYEKYDIGNYTLNIPKDEVNKYLTDVFDVEIDDSTSQYCSEDMCNYILTADVMGGIDMPDVQCTSFEESNNNVILKCIGGHYRSNAPYDENAEVTFVPEVNFDLEINLLPNQQVKYISCRFY